MKVLATGECSMLAVSVADVALQNAVIKLGKEIEYESHKSAIDNHVNDSPINEGRISPIYMMEKLDVPRLFVDKRKGHERPYKFHR